jgi:pseudouridine synthase
MLERLQKILSRCGIASRRKAEEYIEQGLVTINGQIAKIGDKADPEKDQIEVSGKVLEERAEMLYYLLYKPVGVVTTNTERKEDKTIIDLLPKNLHGKVYPVGRLDKDSEGLLLLTNDGVLAYRLTHPKFDHEKEYEVMVANDLHDGQLQKMRDGLKIFGEMTKSADVKRSGERTFRIALTEGKNRQIRRMCAKIGNPVVTLKRIRIMTLKDDRMRPGDLRPLGDTEKQELLRSVGL